MPRPTDVLTWATNLNHPTVGDPWDGLPTKVAPSVGRRQEGYIPEQLVPAEELNALFGNAMEWAEYLQELTDPDASRFMLLQSPDMVQRDPIGWDFQGDTLVSSGGVGRVCYIPVPALLPSASAVTSIQVLVLPGAARATTGDRFMVSVSSVAPAVGTAAPVVTLEDLVRTDGTATAQWVDLTFDPGLDVSKGAGYFFQIQSGLTAGTDTIYQVRLEYNAMLLDR